MPYVFFWFLLYADCLESLFIVGQHTVLLIAYHTCCHTNTIVLHMSDVDSVGKFGILPGCVEQLGPWTCVFHDNHKVNSACKDLTNLQFVLCLI